MTPLKRNKAAIKKIEECMERNFKVMGYMAQDLYTETIDKDYYDNEISSLFWENNKFREILLLLEGEE